MRWAGHRGGVLLFVDLILRRIAHSLACEDNIGGHTHSPSMGFVCGLLLPSAESSRSHDCKFFARDYNVSWHLFSFVAASDRRDRSAVDDVLSAGDERSAIGSEKSDQVRDLFSNTEAP